MLKIMGNENINNFMLKNFDYLNLCISLCFQSNFKADPGYSCPLCNRAVSDITNIQPVTIDTSLNTEDETDN